MCQILIGIIINVLILDFVNIHNLNTNKIWDHLFSHRIVSLDICNEDHELGYFKWKFKFFVTAKLIWLSLYRLERI